MIMNRRNFLSALAITGASTGLRAGMRPAHRVFAAKPAPLPPLLSAADQLYLRQQARRVMDSAMLKPGEANGKWRNETPYTVHVPGGNMGYPAYWIRDSVMMLESGFISAGELAGWIRLIASTVRQQDWQVRPGVMVPAFAVPDHIDLDGKASYYPGSYDTGTKQGGYPFGKYPPLDDQYYFIHAVYWHWKQSGGLQLFRGEVLTANGPMQLSVLCERVYGMVPHDEATGLCTSGDVKTENAKDFGFCDSVSKSGKLLFPSLLKLLAARQLAEMFAASGAPDKAAHFRNEVAALRRSIAPTFRHAAANAEEAWLYSATGVGNQVDVWGSAYAIYCDALDAATTTKVSRALLRAYHEKSAVREGCVSNVLINDPKNPAGWQDTISKFGVYQNGGYWGTPVGWYLVAMRHADPASAARMARDYVAFLRNHSRADGTAESWEWFNPDTGRNANPLYVATVGLPYGVLRVSGLVENSNMA
jgi:hypothetical protein